MRRLEDQVMILKSIDEVRKELSEVTASGRSGFETHEVFGRLVSLYATLDVSRIADILEKVDKRKRFAKEGKYEI